MKMQGIDAWMCHHPVDEEATLDDLGCDARGADGVSRES
jgi:hypothetical protein